MGTTGLSISTRQILNSSMTNPLALYAGIEFFFLRMVLVSLVQMQAFARAENISNEK